MSAATHEASPSPAGVLPRLGAGLIDGFVLFMQFQVVTFLASLGAVALRLAGRALWPGGPLDEAARLVYGASVVWGSVVALAYFPYWWQRDGQTFGMRLLKLRVVRATDARTDIGPWRAVARGVVAVVGIALAGLGFWWAAVDARQRAWHDLLAGTLVVRTDGGKT